MRRHGTCTVEHQARTMVHPSWNREDQAGKVRIEMKMEMEMEMRWKRGGNNLNIDAYAATGPGRMMCDAQAPREHPGAQVQYRSIPQKRYGDGTPTVLRARACAHLPGEGPGGCRRRRRSRKNHLVRLKMVGGTHPRRTAGKVSPCTVHPR